MPGMTMMMQGITGNIPGISPYSGDSYAYAPNTAEMMLIVAECQARQDQVSDAMQTLNDFRRYRISSSAPSEVLNLTAPGRDEAVGAILEERANFRSRAGGMTSAGAISMTTRQMTLP